MKARNWVYISNIIISTTEHHKHQHLDNDQELELLAMGLKDMKLVGVTPLPPITFPFHRPLLDI